MINRSIDIELTPEELAREFSRMYDFDQARFFNELAKQFHITNFCFQLEYITNNTGLTDDARKIMAQIGEYAYQIKE